MLKKAVFALICILTINIGIAFTQNDDINSITWSNDGDFLAINKNNGAIEIFNVITNQTITIIPPIYGFAYKVEWEPNNQRIATNHVDGIIRVWDVNNGDLLNQIVAVPNILDLEWSQHERLYISSLEGGTDVWDMNTYELIEELDFAAYDFSFSPNEEYLAIGSVRGFTIYNIVTGVNFHVQSSDVIIHVIWNDEGTKLATINLSGDFSVWNLITNEIEIAFQMQYGVLMRWQSNYLYIANSGMINIWDTITWQIASSVPLSIDSFVSRNSNGFIYAEFNSDEIVEISTYCEIIPSGDILALSNAILDGNSIQFRKQICLTKNATYTLTALLPDITGDITLIGNGAQIVMTGGSRIFNVTAPGSLHLKNVTLSGGVADDGGAIYNAGDLTLENVILQNHSAVRGGAIYNVGSLVMNGGAIQNNTASEFGGGIYNIGDMQLDGVNIRENNAPEGSGVYQGMR